MSSKVPESELREDSRRAAEIVDGQPSLQEYNQHGKFSSSTIYNRLGTFTELAEEMGFTTKKITREELKENLKQVAESVDGSPTEKDYNKHGEYSARTVRNRFGSWSSALTEIGLTPNRDIPDELLLEDICRVGEIVEDTPMVKQYEEHGKHGITTIRRRFGTWDNAVR
jgi:hypothetical protein